MRHLKGFFSLSLLFIFLISCTEKSEKLPILGQHDFDTKYQDGVLETDTIYYTLPDFKFTDQNGNNFNENNIQGKVYIADFFFTSCPTICPKMSKNMLKMAQEYRANENVLFLSHSIDTRYDSVPVLKTYSEKLNAPNNWFFVTGEKEDIFGIAEKYMVSAGEDSHAPSGVVHSGAFILLDGKRRIRAYYDGTKASEMKKLEKDIEILLNEKE